MTGKIVFSDKEKEIIGMLDDSLYTVEYIEEWINRSDKGAKGFYRAVKRMAEKEVK